MRNTLWSVKESEKNKYWQHRIIQNSDLGQKNAC